MRQNDRGANARIGLDSHFFTRVFALGTLSAMSIVAVILAAAGSASIYAG